MIPTALADMLETTLADWFTLGRGLVRRPGYWAAAVRLFYRWARFRLWVWRHCRRQGVTRADMVAWFRNPWV